MRVSRDKRLFQLELWTGREYVPVLGGTFPDVQAASARWRPASRRITLMDKDRPRKPKYTRTRRQKGSDRTRESVIDAYMTWAQRAGLRQVAVYCYAGVVLPDGMTARYVDPADFLGPAPEAEEVDDAA